MREIDGRESKQSGRTGLTNEHECAAQAFPWHDDDAMMPCETFDSPER